MDITWLGHAAFEIKHNGETMYIDPFISENPVAPIEVDDIKQADWVLVTHGHFDHYGDAVQIAREHDATLASVFEIAKDAEQDGVDSIEPMNVGGSIETDGPTLHMTNALHSSGGLGHQVGFVIEWDGHRIYHAGDTGLFSDMKLIQEFLEPEIGLIPIGDRFTMGPQSAARAVEFLGVDQVIPIHYNTFEAVEQDPQNFVEQVGNTAEVIVLDQGEQHKLIS